MTIMHPTTRNDIVEAYNQSGAASLDHVRTNSPRLLTTTLQHHEYFQTRLDPSLDAFWCCVSPTSRPVVTQGALKELSSIQQQLPLEFAEASIGGRSPFQYYVFASRVPGMFNLGGDLATFADCARSGNKALVHHYARACIDMIFQNFQALYLPVITIALVQGDALGGGFEQMLSFDVVVAEKGAKFGLPEILFNLFPGMGAYSLLSRKLDAVRAERLITSGELYTAEALFEMGLVDVLAEDGQGEFALAEYIRKESARHSARLAINQTRRRVNPLTLSELNDVADIWTEAVFRLSDANLRKMERLARAQSRRMARLDTAQQPG